MLDVSENSEVNGRRNAANVREPPVIRNPLRTRKLARRNLQVALGIPLNSPSTSST